MKNIMLKVREYWGLATLWEKIAAGLALFLILYILGASAAKGHELREGYTYFEVATILVNQPKWDFRCTVDLPPAVLNMHSVPLGDGDVIVTESPRWDFYDDDHDGIIDFGYSKGCTYNPYSGEESWKSLSNCPSDP